MHLSLILQGGKHRANPIGPGGEGSTEQEGKGAGTISVCIISSGYTLSYESVSVILADNGLRC